MRALGSAIACAHSRDLVHPIRVNSAPASRQTRIECPILTDHDQSQLTPGTDAAIDVFGIGSFVTRGMNTVRGRVVVFKSHGANVRTLTHELVHSLGAAHRCGNWNYTSTNTSLTPNACVMHYENIDAVLTEPDASGLKQPEPWVLGPRNSLLCEEHIYSIRRTRLDEVYGW